MSALARYFAQKGSHVAGYDRTRSPLTATLEKEGIHIVYDDGDKAAETQRIAETMPAKDTLVVRTPAVPEGETLYIWLRENGYQTVKRAELLGIVSRMPHKNPDGTCSRTKALCVAGTHGKTTTSTLLAHILHNSSKGANAFLGGISNNTGSNLLTDAKSDLVVVEADEFDRSFHKLSPYMSVITSIDPDHLDIYGSAEAYQEAFDTYAGLVEDTIILHKGCRLNAPHCRVLTYSATEKADFMALNIRAGGGSIVFDMLTPDCTTTDGHRAATTIKDIRLGVPAWINIENSVAAMATAWLNGATEDELKNGVSSFRGVYRRFDMHIDTPKVTYIDDYAHHPTELQASLMSVRKIYPDRRLTAVFQPHLYSRTRDFMEDFAKVLNTADELILLPIYPARELPIEGITSEKLAEECRRHGNDSVTTAEKEELADRLAALLEDNRPRVIMTLGAGDIDRLVPEITKQLSDL